LSDARNLIKPQNTPQKPSETPVAHTDEDYSVEYFVKIPTPILDPAKLDTLKGKRAATPRLRKACYWLQMAHTAGFNVGQIIDSSYDPDDPYGRL